MNFLESLVDQAKKKKQQIERGAQAVVAQVNPADNGRTYQTVMSKGADYTPPAQQNQSAFHQLTHNGATNFVGNGVAKPALRLGFAVNQGIGNLERKAAGMPTLDASHYYLNSPLTNKLRKASGYTGTKRQIAGDLLTTATNVAAPGGSKLLEGGAAKVLPKVIPKIVPKVVSTATVGAPVGAVSNVGAYVSGNEPLTKKGVIKSAEQGAIAGFTTGAALPVAGALIGKSVKLAAPAVERTANATKVANVSLGESGKVKNPLASGNRPYADVQKAIEDAHNSGDQATVVKLINEQVPAADQPAMRSALGIAEPTTPTGQLGRATGQSEIPSQIQEGPQLEQQPKTLSQSNVPSRSSFADNIPSSEQNVFEGNPMLPENQPELIGSDAGIKQPELPTYNTKKVGNFDKAFRSTRSIIERQGESGKQLGGMLQGARDTQEIYLANLQKHLPTVRSLKGKNFENFVEATQGKVQPANERVARAVQEWQSVHPGIRQRATNAGLDVGDLGPNYYPHFIDYDKVFKDKNTYNQAINHLVETRQARTPEEAIKLLGYARDVSRNREFGNLEASRLIDLPFYDKTPNGLVSYLGGSARRVAQAETFGPKDENALNLIKGIGVEGGDTEAAKNAYDIAVGAKHYNPTSEKISNNIRRYVTTTRLGLGAITNVSQNVNTGIVTGHMRTLASVFKQLNPKTRSFVGDTGVIADAVLSDLRTQSGYASFGQKAAGKVIDKATAPLFGTVEKMNRAIAATAGRDYALRLAQTGDEATLRRLGVKGNIVGKTLTPEQQIQAARKVVEKTQFKVDAQDLPGWTDSPGGKLVSQFRTFSYAQGKFISNEVLKPAAKGNFTPLARLLAALPLGYALYETKRKIGGRPEEENKTKIGLQAFQNVGGAGLVFDLYQSLNPIGSKYLPPDRRTSMAIGAAGGPAVGVAAQGVGAISEAIQRKNTPIDETRLQGKVVAGKNGNDYTDLTSLARFGLQQVPIVGTPIKNRVLPFTTESNADAGKPGKTDNISLDSAITDAKKTDKQQQKDFNSKFSKQDLQLYRLNQTERKTLVSKGVVSKEKFDSLDKYASQLKQSMGKDIGSKDVNLAGDDRGAALVNGIGNMSSDDRKGWVKQNLDTKYKDLYDRAAQIRVAGMPDLPQTNSTLKAYSDYLQTKAKNPSQLKLNQAKKDFLKNAYQGALSDTSQELLGNYTVADKANAIASGAVDPKDLDAAIAYDDLMIKSGLSATPRISNTIRRKFNYSDAPKAGSSSGGSSSGKSKGGGKKKGRTLKASDFKLPTDITTKYATAGARLAMNAKL